MRQLQPVDVIVDLDVPESGFFADDTMYGPYWTTAGVSRTFFARRSHLWLADHFAHGHVVLDGYPVVIPRRTSTNYRYWRLVDVERTAHALAQNGYLDIDQLVRVVEQVRLIAESWGHIEPRSIMTRVETFDPNRQEVHVVEQRAELTDDLDGSPDARPRSFVVGSVTYHLDLTDEHWQDLVAALGLYIAVARRDTDVVEDPALRADRSQIRSWAREHGYQVAGKGPIPIRVVRAYLTREDA